MMQVFVSTEAQLADIERDLMQLPDAGGAR